MSIVRMVTRLCAVGALRGNTWAGDRVYNSENTPLAQALEKNDQPKPYIVVYTDADNRTDISGTEVYGGTRTVSLTLEVAVASTIDVNGVTEIHLPQTDAAMELALDVTESQCVAAIVGDPLNKWGELFRLLVNSVVRMPSTRGAQAGRGVHWAARQLTMVCDTIFDAPPGVMYQDDHPVRMFIELARAEPLKGLAEAAAVLEKVLTTTEAPSWEQDQAWLGMTKRAIRSTGWAPLTEALGGSTPLPFETTPDVVDEDREGPDLMRVTIQQQDDGESTAPEDIDPEDMDYSHPVPEEPKPL